MFKGLLYSILSSCGFGMGAVIAKLAYQSGLSPNRLLQIRFTLALPLMLLVLLLRSPGLLRITFPVLWKAALMGGLLYGLQSSLFYTSLTIIPASTAALVLYLYPVVVALLSRAFFGLRLEPIILLSLGLVVVGVGLVFYDAFTQSVEPLGLLLVLGSMVCFSAYLLIAQAALRGEEPLAVSFYVILFAAVTFNLLAGPENLLSPGLPGLAYGGAMALLSTVMAISLLYLAIEKIGSTYVSIFSTLEPVATILAAYLILAERVVLWQLVGVVLIVGGISTPNLRSLVRARS